MDQSPYLNADGTFKGGFDGCVLHMTKIEGHSQESARAICGKIAQEKLRNRAGTSVLSGDFKHPADGWYQIEAPGEHPNEEAGVIQVIDQAAISSIVNRFNREADDYDAAHGAGSFPGMLIDIEHFKDDPTKETRAYGWLMRLENREGKPYGQIRWTRSGKEAVDGGEYRFFSSEYDPPDVQILGRTQNRDPKSKKPALVRIRPLRLTGLSLTNMPNNKGIRPITNRHGAGAPPVDKPQPETHKKQTMQKLAAFLGLSAEASEDAILTEVTKLRNRADKAEQDLVPLRNRVTAIEAENKTLLEAQVEADLEPLKIHLSAEEITPLREQLIKNRAGTLPTVQILAAKLGKKGDAGGGGGGTSRITNRAGAKTPGDKAGAAAGGADQGNEEELARQRDKEVREYALRNRCTNTEAWDAVRRDKPELFGIVRN